MLYQITDGTVSAGGRTILSHIDFTIKGKEKIALVGSNGAGKTTLLRLIAGELSLDRDDRRKGVGVQMSRALTIGMLRQFSGSDGKKTVEELMLEGCPAEEFRRERFAYEAEYDRLFTAFGFQKEQKSRTLSSFSGGEQTKIELIRLLLLKPDILLLDEPTNHLDMETVEWLEDYLREYEKAVIMVSHDRFFLDRTADTVYDLENGRLTRYAGNYTAFCKQKEKAREQQQKAYDRQQAEIARLNGLIRQFKHKPKKAAFARSRKSILERMEKVTKPETAAAYRFAQPLEPKMPGSRWVYEAKDLKIGYRNVLAELSLRIRKGRKIGIIGANGSGKSTFLKTVVGLIEPLSGEGRLGNKIKIGFFEQHVAELDSPKNIWEHFGALFPGMTDKERRTILGKYLFTGSSVGTPVRNLSGGEKARLVLAELLTARPNFLVLDEPTNHMDIPAKETLESAFLAYTGTMLFVTHDRYFLQRVADSLLVFEGGSVYFYPFGYEHYLTRKRRMRGADAAAMIRAEEAAMIEGLRAVPKAERHDLREPDAERAHVDWKLRLASEPMNRAGQEAERLRRQWEELDARLALARWQEAFPQYGGISGESTEELEREMTFLREELADREALWTDFCVEWYLVWEGN